jgi:hypothetical protein
MKKIITAGLAIALASFVSQPAQALTPEEALGIGIGVTALTCALSNGCSNQRQQPAYYPSRRYYRSNSVIVVPVAPVRSGYRDYRRFDRYEDRYDRYQNRHDRYRDNYDRYENRY